MRTKSIWRHLAWGLLGLASQQAFSQASQANNNGGATSFLGWNAGANQILNVKNEANQPIQWYTNNLLRMKLNQNISYTIGAFTGQAKNGALGLSPTDALWTSGPGPFSRLHLHDGTNMVLSAGYRSWMDNGITLTTNSDQMYVGHKVETGTDQTAAVIQWSDNDAPTAGPDVMKFIFTSGYTGGSGQNSLSGLEIGRFHPGGWFGLGNWQAGTAQPDERLDLLTRTIRLRDFVSPTLYRNDTYDRILVANPADGRVYWRPVSSVVASSCDWIVQATNDVSNTYAGTTCPWNDSNGVGIGIQFPKAKLHVVHDNSSPTFTGDVTLSVLNSPTNGGRALTGQARTPLSSQFANTTFMGVRGLAANARYSYGVSGEAGIAAASPGPAVDIIGVRGLAGGNNNAGRAIGVFGQGSGAGAQSWAIWSEGSSYSTVMGGWTSSDLALKTDIQPITGALDQLLQLQPSRYLYRTTDLPFLHLAEGEQFGLIAQEVEDVLPQLVRSVHRPADLDSLGNEINPAMDIMSVNYDLLIPLLVAGMQEQQAQISQLQEQLAACCAAPSDDGTRVLLSDAGSVEGMERALLIQPNPFSEATTLYYTLERSGRMQLIANSADGKQLRVLNEANLEAGQYQFEWQTNELTPGVYYVTLLLDGEPIVKKAVKLQR